RLLSTARLTYERSPANWENRSSRTSRAREGVAGRSEQAQCVLRDAACGGSSGRRYSLVAIKDLPHAESARRACPRLELGARREAPCSRYFAGCQLRRATL